MRISLVVNARSGASRDAMPVGRFLRAAGAEVEVFDIAEPARAAEGGPDRIVVAGGDGSVAPVAAVAGAAGIDLAVVPEGTANDFARALGLPLDGEEACRLAAEGTRTRSLDLARLDGRPFVNAANAGLAVHAARRARPLKARLGPLAYGVGALRAAFAAEPVRCIVRCDERKVFAGAAWQVIVANTGAFGAGSELDVARPDDGLLDVAVVPRGPRLALAWRGAGLRSGRLTEQRGVVHHRGVEVAIRTDGAHELNVDGEVRRQGPESRCTVAPDAFALVVGR